MVAVILERTQCISYLRFFIIFGLAFAEISNFAYFGILENLPEVYDIFLIISLFLVILEEYRVINPYSWIKYILFLGSFNNFLITYFIFLWGYFSPDKDLALVTAVGLPGIYQVIFDAISLAVLLYSCRKYKQIIGSGKMSFNRKVLFMQLALIVAIFSECLI